LIALVTVLVSAPPPASAAVNSTAPHAGGATQASQPDPGRKPGALDVIEVTGRIDPIMVDFVERSLRRAAAGNDEVVVVRLDSRGSLVGRRQLDRLVALVADSKVPVAVWVGPTGARAYGGAFKLLGAARVAGMAPGARVGRSPTNGVADAIGVSAARRQGIVDNASPTLGDFLANLNGRDVGGRTLITSRVVTSGGTPHQEAAGEVRFAKIGLVERVLHATARPTVAYLLLVVGLLLLVFEFFTAGIGVAGVTGAASLVLAAYGLAVLPTSPVALAAIGLGVFGFAVDVQTGAPRAWTVIGGVALFLGSWRLFPGDLALSWLAMVFIIGGAAVLMISGMAAMVRSRFSTPTIGRESMTGEMGEATSGVDPEGTVRIQGAVWRARTNRATPIAAGDPVRVVGIDGLLLEVEPEEGGAKDAHH